MFIAIHAKIQNYNPYISPCTGKPQAVQFQYVAQVLASEAARIRGTAEAEEEEESFQDCFDTVVMVGDNPTADIRGANNAGDQWQSVLVRTGVFTGKENDPVDPADFVFDNVGEAVHSMLSAERY